MTNYYGIESTDDVQYDKQGLPLGFLKVKITAEEPDAQGRGLIAEYEVLSPPEHKGKRGKQWYLTTHSNPTTANIAKQNLKRIADATGMPVAATTPLKGRVLKVEVREQKNDSSRTEIFKYHNADHEPAESFDAPV